MGYYFSGCYELLRFIHLIVDDIYIYSMNIPIYCISHELVVTAQKFTNWGSSISTGRSTSSIPGVLHYQDRWHGRASAGGEVVETEKKQLGPEIELEPGDLKMNT